MTAAPLTGSPTKLEVEPTFTAPEYKFHEIANIFPMLSKEELTELAEDIKKQGLLFPIMLYEGKILDGRNRYLAAKQCGYQFKEYDFGERHYRNPKAYVISANITRRHLTPAKRRELIAELIKDQPELSNRQIAEQAKTSHVTVGAVRAELEATGQIDQLPATKGKDGKTRKTKAKAGGSTVQDDPPGHSMKKYKAFLEAVLDALAKWPRDRVQAVEWSDYTLEQLATTMHERWPAEQLEAAE
jgi:hypothetical protein